MLSYAFMIKAVILLPTVQQKFQDKKDSILSKTEKI